MILPSSNLSYYVISIVRTQSYKLPFLPLMPPFLPPLIYRTCYPALPFLPLNLPSDLLDADDRL